MVALRVIGVDKQGSYFNLLQSLWKIIAFELDVWLPFRSVDVSILICLWRATSSEYWCRRSHVLQPSWWDHTSLLPFVHSPKWGEIPPATLQLDICWRTESSWYHKDSCQEDLQKDEFIYCLHGFPWHSALPCLVDEPRGPLTGTLQKLIMHKICSLDLCIKYSKLNIMLPKSFVLH